MKWKVLAVIRPSFFRFLLPIPVTEIPKCSSDLAGPGKKESPLFTKRIFEGGFMTRQLVLAIVLFLPTSVAAQEIALFNSDGEPVAYIDSGDEDLPVYMWNGVPVAYLAPDENGFHIYGFNGRHIGWFENGIVRDHAGFAVGFQKGAVNAYTKYEPYKSYKQYKPYMAYRQYAPYKPYYRDQFSGESLSLLLMRGRN